jgi:hypothetical protein
MQKHSNEITLKKKTYRRHLNIKLAVRKTSLLVFFFRYIAFMGMTAPSVKSLKIIHYFLVVTRGLLDRWQDQSWFQNGRDCCACKRMSSERDLVCRMWKTDWNLRTFAWCMVKLLWMWVLFDGGDDRWKKLKEEQQYFMVRAEWSHLPYSLTASF